MICNVGYLLLKKVLVVRFFFYTFMSQAQPTSYNIQTPSLLFYFFFLFSFGVLCVFSGEAFLTYSIGSLGGVMSKKYGA